MTEHERYDRIVCATHTCILHYCSADCTTDVQCEPSCVSSRESRRGDVQRDVRARLDAALQTRDRARAELDDAEGRLRQAVRDADAVGISQAELAELTGWHRNTIRRIVTDG